MSIVALLRRPDNPTSLAAFEFEHAMAHRTLYATMGPLHRWSVLPYFLDPSHHVDTPASHWHLRHQQAHNDFTSSIPSGYERMDAGVPTSQILIDSNLDNAESRTWWTFANHTEHFIANESMLPLPNTGTRTGLPSSFPWWIPAPRWTLPPYW